MNRDQLLDLWERNVVSFLSDIRSVSGSCSHVASSLPDGALTCICGCYGDTMIPGGVPEPRQGFPGQNQVCFNAELPEGLKVTETFPDSLNL